MASLPSPSVHATVDLHGVYRSFGAVKAIVDLTMEVAPGTVTVLVGPNGAGKTTTMRIITGVIRPHRGHVRVFGLDPAEHGNEIRRRCGVVPPKPAMYERLTGRENLAYAAALYDIDNAPIAPLADQFGIAQALDLRVAGYSTGMRTRLALARSLLHDPEFLILDEPTAGLDPESAVAVRELILETARTGKTVLMSTHLLHEAEGTADQLIMMDAGRAWERGTPGDLAGRYLNGLVVRFDAEDRATLEALTSIPEVRVLDRNGGMVAQIDPPSALPTIVNRLVESGAAITRVEPQTPTLERLYFEMRRQARGTP